MRKLMLIALVLVVLPGLVACEGSGGNSTPGSYSGARPPQGSAWVIFSSDTVQAEVADTPAARQQGLMFRENLDPAKGMLFVFEEELPHSFFMRNTIIPLDIAWLNRLQVIVDIQQMDPETEELHTPSQPALFALEVPQGWFANERIEVGQRAQIVFGRR